MAAKGQGADIHRAGPGRMVGGGHLNVQDRQQDTGDGLAKLFLTQIFP